MAWFSKHPKYDPWANATPRELALRNLITEGFKAMSVKGDELKAAIDDLAAELATNNAAIEKELTRIATPGTSDAEVDAAVSRIRSLISDNKAEVDKLSALPSA